MPRLATGQGKTPMINILMLMKDKKLAS